MKKDDIHAYLKTHCPGQGSTVSSFQLEQALHISGNDLRKHINRLRQEGIPIASRRRGYFYARTAGELYATIRALEKMRKGLDAAITGLEGSFNSFHRGDGA